MTMEIDLVNIKIMCCIFCYQNPVIRINPRTQVRKGLISYYKTNGITSLKKHVDANHFFIAQMFEKK
jgi:ribosomal protein L16 Arg81 hydroxylase